MSLFLSFDIGIRNLSVCGVVATKGCENVEIVLWKNISLLSDTEKKKSVNINEISGRLFMELDDITNSISDEIDTVLLENQPSNGIIKTIQIMIYSYYQLRRHWEGKVKNVQMVSANQKLLNHPHELSLEQMNIIKNKSKYQITKCSGVEIAKKYIENNEECMDIFNSYKKKDDICDSFLQCISYLNKKNYGIKYSFMKCAIKTI